MCSFLVKNNIMQQHCVEVMKRLACQRNDEHFCDVVLEVGSGEDKAHLKAHRNVLCAASPFFYNALNTEMKEKKEGVIRLKDTSASLMEEVLEYMYTGCVDIYDENVFDLMELADYFLVSSLKYACVMFIGQTLSPSNCITAYYSGVKYGCPSLQDQARDFILANFIAVTETEGFLNLDVEQIEEWISSDEIIVKSEEDVFAVILKWTEKTIKRTKDFIKLFRHVRFIYVSRNFIFKVILPHRMVEGEKQCVDLVLNAMKKISDGTEACFLELSPRRCLIAHENAIVACGGKETFCYLPTENKWYELPVKEFKRNPFGLALSACQGKCYVIGGNASGCAVECYYPVLNSWGPVKSFKQKIKFAAAITFQGFLFVLGGVKDEKRHLSTVYKYNPDTNVWQEAPSLSSGRYGICVVADESYLYAIGGVESSNGSNIVVNLAEKFDPEVNSWISMAPTQASRRHSGGVSLHNKIFVFGGVDLSDGSPCEVYDKVTNVWTEIANVVASRYPTSAVCFKEQIFVFGRFGPNQSESAEGTLQVFDVELNEWKPCHSVSLGSNFLRLSAVRIPREVLESLKEVSRS